MIHWRYRHFIDLPVEKTTYSMMVPIFFTDVLSTAATLPRTQRHLCQNSCTSLQVVKLRSICKVFAGWWFGTFLIFPYIGNNHRNWPIFFGGVAQPPTRFVFQGTILFSGGTFWLLCFGEQFGWWLSVIVILFWDDYQCVISSHVTASSTVQRTCRLRDELLVR